MARTAIPSLMRAVQIAEFGAPEVMKVASKVHVPKPGSTQVLIQMKYAGVNPVDTYVRAGNRATLPSLPYTPGKDGAGVVVAVGDGVSRFQEGDRVYTHESNGSYAEYAVADEWNTHILHDTLTFKAGAGIGIPYCTAYRAIFQKSKAKPGEAIFIHGASGGVGLACVQMARASGMVVLGSAGTKAGMDLVIQNGAHHAFNHSEEGYVAKIMAEVPGTGVDVIIEMLANVNLENDLKMMAKNGRVAVVGNRGSIEMNPRLTMAPESSIVGVFLPSASQSELEEMSHFLYAGQEAGWINPSIGQEFSMEEAPTAHTEVIAHTGGTKGKFVLKISD